MPSAIIRVDQPSHPTQVTGIAGRCRDDIVNGALVQLANADNTGVRSWRWTIIDQPNKASPVSLTAPTSAVASFTPNAVGTYLIELTINDGLVGQKVRQPVIVRDGSGYRIPAWGEGEQANYLVGGSENQFGWWRDVQALLEVVRTGAIAVSQRVLINHTFSYLISSGDVYVPFKSTTETATVTDHQAAMVAPFDGYLNRVFVRSSEAHGNTTINLARNQSATVIHGATVNMAVDSTLYTFSLGSSASFSAGDLVHVEFSPSANNASLWMQTEWMYSL